MVSSGVFFLISDNDSNVRTRAFRRSEPHRCRGDLPPTFPYKGDGLRLWVTKVPLVSPDQLSRDLVLSLLDLVYLSVVECRLDGSRPGIGRGLVMKG